jgi:hypothetical protein
VYQFVETVGNIRLDRVAVAVEMDAKRPEPHRIYVRFTGAANRKWLAAFFRQHFPEETTEQGPQAEPVTILSNPKDAPAFALVGDTDLVVAGYEKDRAKHRDVVEQLLQVRAQGKGGLRTGPLGGTLKDVPPQASALLAAELSDGMQKALAGRGLPLPVAPRRLLLDATRTRDLAVRLRALMNNPAGARTLAGALTKLQDQAVERLKNPPPEARLPAGALGPVQKMLAGARIEVQGDTVRARGGDSV